MGQNGIDFKELESINDDLNNIPFADNQNDLIYNLKEENAELRSRLK